MSSRRQREVLSPIVTTPNVPHKENLSHFSTSASTLAACSPSTLLMEQQDDELERKARRRSRVLDLQRKVVASPSSPADRRQSLPLNGLSTVQLTEHYTNCIKLSAENKINSKNAFGLHLIDYMSELLKKKELENFQVASTTLDASAKIYAGRVDAIHAETYKVLTGLGRSSEKGKDADGTGEEPMEGQDGQEGDVTDSQDNQKKKKKTRKSKTVETNLKNLNVNKFEIEFEVDPLFKMMTAAFDEGGSSGLLLNNLRTYDNTQQLVLDSNTLISPTGDLNTTGIEERREFVDISDHKDLFQDENKNMLVCPAFSTFNFTDWDSTEQTTESVPALSSSQTEHRFDMEADPEPMNDQDNVSVFGGGDGSYTEDLDVEDVADTYLDVGTDNCIGDGKAAQLVQSVMSDMTHGTTSSLMQVLSTERSDYSYFNNALIRTWAGPGHWKVGSLIRDSWKSSIQSKSQKSKQKKVLFRMDFDEEIDFASKFKIGKGTVLTKSTLSKYSKDQTTLPKDHHYDADKLFRLFLLKRRMIKRQQIRTDVDDAIDNYDYENVNDRENYCPNPDDNDDDDSGDLEFGNFTGGGDFASQESSSQDPFSQSQDVFTAPHNPFDVTSLSGDQLLAQPYKVAKINIDYAKTAKKLDVKRLKSSMWNIMKSAPSGDQQPSNIEEDGNTNNSAELPGMSALSDSSKEMPGSLTFQQLLNDLPEKVSGQTAKNLSVPIAFVCLLHLANEKTLKIEDKDMEDLLISQGL